VALGEVTHEEVLVERREIESAAGFVDQLQPIRVWTIVQLLVDPLDGLSHRRFPD
jgi:hypothetical protein